MKLTTKLVEDITLISKHCCGLTEDFIFIFITESGMVLSCIIKLELTSDRLSHSLI